MSVEFVAAQAPARGGEVQSKTDGQTYRFVRLLAEEPLTGLKEGTYLLDPTTGAAKYEREDGTAPAVCAPQARLMPSSSTVS